MSKRSAEIEQDARFHRDIEDAMLFLGLGERGFGCPDPMYFDGVCMAWPSMFARLTRDVGRGDAAIDRAADGLAYVRGGCVLHPDDPASGVRYELVAGKQLDVIARKRLLMLTGGKAAGGDTIPAESRIIEVRHVSVMDSGEMRQRHRNYWYRGRHGWWTVYEGTMSVDRETGRVHSVPNLAFSVSVLWAHAAEHAWYVKMRVDDAMPGISLFTDPTGIKEYFKFRDVPDGGKRRDALANWVSEHWRQKRDDPDVEVYVREHLRGKSEFTWHGLHSKIHVPAADVARNVQAEARRKRTPAAELMRRRNRA